MYTHYIAPVSSSCSEIRTLSVVLVPSSVTLWSFCSYPSSIAQPIPWIMYTAPVSCSRIQLLCPAFVPAPVYCSSLQLLSQLLYTAHVSNSCPPVLAPVSCSCPGSCLVPLPRLLFTASVSCSCTGSYIQFRPGLLLLSPFLYTSIQLLSQLIYCLLLLPRFLCWYSFCLQNQSRLLNTAPVS